MTDNKAPTPFKFAIVPVWVLERIKAAVRLECGTWAPINKAIADAETPDVLPCDVKVAPATVFQKGTPLATLLMAMARRNKPGATTTFAAPGDGKVIGSIDVERNDYLSAEGRAKTLQMGIIEPSALGRFTQRVVRAEDYDDVANRLALTELAREGDAIEIEGLKALCDQIRDRAAMARNVAIDLTEAVDAFLSQSTTANRVRLEQARLRYSSVLGTLRNDGYLAQAQVTLDHNAAKAKGGEL